MSAHADAEAGLAMRTERDRVGHDALERRELARLAARHVVLVAVSLEDGLRLGADLEEANEEDDLELGRRRQGVPLVGGEPAAEMSAYDTVPVRPHGKWMPLDCTM